MAAKILALAIDAASPDLLETWAADGTLPHLGALIRRGLLARTRSVEGFFIGATWPSFATGVSPARHGIHYLVQLRPGTYAYYRPDVGGVQPCPPFWTTLSRAGRRVAILDVPLSRADPGVNGMQIVEWGSHDAAHGFHAWPRAVEQDVRSAFGEHPAIAPCDGVTRSIEGYAAFIDALVQGVRRKTDLTRHYLRQGGWICSSRCSPRHTARAISAGTCMMPRIPRTMPRSRA